MPLSKKEVQHIANLSNLHLSNEMIEKYRVQMDSVLDYVQKLNEINTDNIAELQHTQDVINVFREDVPVDCDSKTKKAIIENFSHRKGDLLEVQAVFDDTEK